MRKSRNHMEIRSKVWIEIDGEPVFGSGRCDLLKAIETHGSINQAAKDMKISYRKAWSYIENMEKRLGMKLVERHTGGRHGGGAVLTKDARDFLKKFEAIESGFREIADRKFRTIFKTDPKS